MLHILIVQR